MFEKSEKSQKRLVMTQKGQEDAGESQKVPKEAKRAWKPGELEKDQKEPTWAWKIEPDIAKGREPRKKKRNKLLDEITKCSFIRMNAEIFKNALDVLFVGDR